MPKQKFHFDNFAGALTALKMQGGLIVPSAVALLLFSKHAALVLSQVFFNDSACLALIRPSLSGVSRFEENQNVCYCFLILSL